MNNKVSTQRMYINRGTDKERNAHIPECRYQKIKSCMSAMGYEISEDRVCGFGIRSECSYYIMKAILPIYGDKGRWDVFSELRDQLLEQVIA